MFEQLLHNVPDYQAFLTVDEMDQSSLALAVKYPDICQCTIEGYSRANHPIYCLKIGTGKKKAFMFGCPHPNEPMGAMMLEYFSEALCKDDKLREDLGYTWYLIKSIDIDGTKLNEKWFKGPFNLYNYARNFFRPAGYEQAEWTFPITYKNYTFDKPIPETQILMKIIDRIKPDFLYSLHNAGFGGAYWYITYNTEKLWDQFYQAVKSQKIPLHLGEPEAPFIVPLAPAIYKMTGLKDNYDFMEKFSGRPAEQTMMAGASSDEYASKYGTCCLVAELPYYYSPKIEDHTELKITRKEATLNGAKFSYDDTKKKYELYKKYENYVSEDNPYCKMLNMMFGMNEDQYNSQVAFINANEEFNQPCKVSEAFDNYDVKHFYILLSWGLLIRGLEFELDHVDNQVKIQLTELLNKFEEMMKVDAAKAEEILSYEFVPIQRLVRAQLASGMIVADYIAHDPQYQIDKTK